MSADPQGTRLRHLGVGVPGLVAARAVQRTAAAVERPRVPAGGR